MGRHSAPDDDAPLDEPGAGQVALREREVAPSRGRHYRGDDSDSESDFAEAETGRIPLVTAPLADDLPVGTVEVPDVAVVVDAAAVDQPVLDEPASDEVSLAELIGTDELVDDVTERIPPVVDDRPVGGDRPRPGGSPPPPAPPTVEPRPGTPPFSDRQPPPPEHSKQSKRGGSPQVAVKHAAHNSAADLHLVRSSRTVLALCVLAVLIPFAVDLVVLTVLDDLTLRRFLVWIWAPLIAAGVLVGVVLDAGHRRHATG